MFKPEVGVMMSETRRWSGLSLGLVLLFLLGTGCSRLSPLDNGGTGLPASGSSDYPPITEELLQNGPAPGHPIVTLERPSGMMSVENWDYAEVWVKRNRGDYVRTSQGSGCMIGNYALPQDTLITVTLPVEGYAIVDFGPHPLQFHRDIWLVLSLNGTSPSDDSDGDGWHDFRGQRDLTIFYYNEETGEYEPYPSYYDPHRNALMCLTNHFSRYIIA
jgi:hypothetical protein